MTEMWFYNTHLLINFMFIISLVLNKKIWEEFQQHKNKINGDCKLYGYKLLGQVNPY